MWTQTHQETVAIGNEHGKNSNDYMSHCENIVKKIVIDESGEPFGWKEVNNWPKEPIEKRAKNEGHREAWMNDISEMAT